MLYMLEHFSNQSGCKGSYRRVGASGFRKSGLSFMRSGKAGRGWESHFPNPIVPLSEGDIYKACLVYINA